MTGKISTNKSHSGKINVAPNTTSKISSGGSTDHNRLFNREAADQHPIEAITGLEDLLEAKLDAKTALPLINTALKTKACGLYYDAMKELNRKAYWYLTSEIDPITKMGTKKSIISGPYDLGMGGGSGSGGGGGVTTVTVKPYEWPSTAVLGATSKVQITWTSAKDGAVDPTITGTVYLSVNDRQVETRRNQKQGIIEFDITEFVASGDNTIQVKILDMYGSTGITIGVVNGVSLDLESDFDNTSIFEKDINFTYNPIGDVAKTVYFYIDGEEHGYQVVTTSNEVQTYIIKGLTHGSHALEVYFKALVGGEVVESKHLFYDLIVSVPGNYTPIIASDFKALEQEQYISFNIPYRAYIYNRNQVEVSLKINDELIRTYEVNTTDIHIWSHKFDEPGNYKMEIVCGTISKIFNIHVVETTVNVTPVEEGLALALSAHGRSNNENPDERATWSYTNSRGETYDCSFNNFNWSSDGWILDKDGNSILSVGGDARVEIPLKVFANDFKANGKTIELEIATRNIRDYDTTIISCLDNKTSPFYTVEEFLVQDDIRAKGFEVDYSYSILTNVGLPLGKHIFEYNGNNWTLNGNAANLNDYGITLTETVANLEGEELGSVILGDKIIVNYSLEARGFEITPQVASIRSQQSFLSTQYKEDEHIRISFVVEQTAKDRIIWMYINGVASGAMQYPVDDTFMQLDPSVITIGSSDAIVDIYNIRIYNNSLTNKQIVNNWLADMQNPTEKLSLYQQNNVLDERGEVLMEKLPATLPYIIWEIDRLPESKEDKRTGNARYIDPSIPSRNFTAKQVEYKVQGTSSSVYPTKNIRMKIKKPESWYDDNGDLIKDPDNGKDGFPITYPGGIGADYFTFKVDYASSEGANNVELTKLYNDASIKYGLLTPPQYQQYAQWESTEDINIRVGIDGFPVVAFYQDLEGNIKFHTKANFNNDKANETVYGFADGDESWETTNNSAAEAKYQIPVNTENFDRGFEIRFPDEDGYNNMSKLGPMTEWVYSTYRDKATNSSMTPVTIPIASAVIKNKDDENITFIYNYETEVDDEGNETQVLISVTFTHDTSDYRLSKFKYELSNWFNVDSCLFYYLFTELFLMIDSRAKNAFPTYFATRTNTLALDKNKQPIPNTYTDGGNRWYWIPYDMDTAIGIDNKGKLSFDYYLEDTDQLDGADVYNGQTSVMWCNVRDAFNSELNAMYAELRNQGLIDYDEVERRFEEHQGKWPQVILNQDSHNKYIVPLKNGDNYLEMLQGTKEQQRKWWLYNRFKYVDSKRNAGDAKSDFIQFRAYVDVGEEKPDITIIPYANIYATVSFGNGNNYLVSERVRNRNEQIVIKNPFGLMDDENDQETYIYSASQLKSIGDISGFHPDTVKIGNAIRLQELKVGDASPNYKNAHLKELTVGANTLLRSIDARNCVNLGTGATVSPDLSNCTNIEEIYFDGTKIKGIVLPDGGTIKTLHLPGTLKSLTIKNQPLLTDLVIDDMNTTLTESVYSEGGHSFRGIVVKKETWNETSANANLYLADSIDSEAAQIRVNIIDKELYNSIIEKQSILNIVCTYIDARYDLIDKKDIELAEYSTRFIVSSKISDNLVPNISEFIEVTNPLFRVPTLQDFSASLLETLWLEGIPSSAIKAKEFIKNMKAETEVRLIGIDETYSSWREIEEFYNLLDRHYGIKVGDSDEKPKAQVTGTIHVDTIPYQEYVNLSARYPEVKIDAKQIRCTVTFINEGKPHEDSSRSVVYGTTTYEPETPIKDSTQAHYYNFEYWTYGDNKIWTTDTVITSDLVITAVYSEHLQKYKVTFDTDSDLISIDNEHSNLIVEYGSCITAPNLFGVPDGVILEGWFDKDDKIWIFDGDFAYRVLDNITLKAKWIDKNLPSVQVTPVNYNTFVYSASDNLGVVGWAVVKDSTEVPTEWNMIKSQTSISGSYQIESSGNYYFWITDANKNTISKNITAYPINIITIPGIEYYKFTDSENIFATDFAISGTTLTLLTDIDEHYEKLKININTALADSIDTFIVTEPVIIDLACTPKNYKLSFDLGGKGDIDKAKFQIITYLHKAEKPAAQYWQKTGEVIDSWYRDPEFINRWDFDTDVIENNTVLYAKWVAYTRPTVITVEIPETIPNDLIEKYTETSSDAAGNIISQTLRIAPKTISITYSQYKIDSDHRVTVDWGDNSPIEYSTESEVVISLTHTYEKAGTYQISVYGTGGNTNAYYRLGDGYACQLTTPIEYVTDIEFAWDITTLANYALYGSSLKHPRISDYMTDISLGCYAGCMKMEKIEIPKNILYIHDQAFSGCKNATGPVHIHGNIKKVGNNVFDYCENITSFELVCDEPPADFNGISLCRNCVNLTSFTISDSLPIAEQMFAGCTSLTEIAIANEYVGMQAFAGCTNLEKVILTNPKTTFGTYAFDRCPKLETFGPISQTATNLYDFNFAWAESIPNYAFQRTWDENARTNVKEVILPTTLKSIGKEAFMNATALNFIELPDGLETIGESAFVSCHNLKKIEIPASVIDIKNLAFSDCKALTTATIKALSSVTKIEDPRMAWFYQSNKAMAITIPESIFSIVKDQYGKHWNACALDSDNNWIYLDYTSFKD